MSSARIAGESSDWERRANDALSGEGRRAGGARRAVVGVLAGEGCCLSAQEIESRLRERSEPVGTASVYRAVDLLHEFGLVQRVDTGDGIARFEAMLPGGEHHHHAVCDSCGEVAAFEDEPLEEAIDRVAERLEHEVSAHEIVIHGRCPSCAAGRGGRE